MTFLDEKSCDFRGFFLSSRPNAAGEKEMVFLSLSFYIQSVRSPNDFERMNEE
jgi:hypothetical protein